MCHHTATDIHGTAHQSMTLTIACSLQAELSLSTTPQTAHGQDVSFSWGSCTKAPPAGDRCKRLAAGGCTKVFKVTLALRFNFRAAWEGHWSRFCPHRWKMTFFTHVISLRSCPELQQKFFFDTDLNSFLPRFFFFPRARGPAPLFLSFSFIP